MAEKGKKRHGIGHRKGKDTRGEEIGEMENDGEEWGKKVWDATVD